MMSGLSGDKSIFTRRSAVQTLGALAAFGGLRPATVSADTIKVAAADGKKIKIGVPLTYGPFTQPWRRGCWRILSKLKELGAEVETIRGEPTKSSEQNAERQLLDRGIDVLIMGVQSSESATAYIADEAHRRGIKTVGFNALVKDSPAVIEDSWGTAVLMGYYVQDVLKRQGTIVQMSENKGLAADYDQQCDLLDLMTKWEPRMKMLPFMAGGTGTEDEIAKGRDQTLALFQSHPDPDSVNAIISWWWPNTLGAVQAIRRTNRQGVRVMNHYFSDQLLTEMARPDSPIEFSTDAPWHLIGDKVAELAVAQARGDDVPNRTYHVAVTSITKAEAAKTLEDIKSMDAQATEFLKAYGG